MTEGIIQKVIARYYDRVNAEDKILISFIEQELIAEIKKEFNDRYYQHIGIIKKLIGDNQE